MKRKKKGGKWEKKEEEKKWEKKMLSPGIEFIAFEVLDGYYATLRNGTSHCLIVENHIYIFDVCVWQGRGCQVFSVKQLLLAFRDCNHGYIMTFWSP